MKLLSIPISQIRVSRKRFRDATGDMEGLAQSLMSFGQLVPVLVSIGHDLGGAHTDSTQDYECYELEDGFRRFTAMQMNGASHIDAVIKDDLNLDPVLQREIELETNVQREDMTWQQRVSAISEIHKMKLVKDPNWGLGQTAAVAGLIPSRVSENLKVARMMKAFPEIAQAKSFAQALKHSEVKARTWLQADEARRGMSKGIELKDRVWLGDSVARIKEVPDESIHAIITDPPFGVDYDKRVEGTVGTMTSYEDSTESYKRLLSMAPDLYRVLKPNGWLIWFFGMSWYSQVKETFRNAGFTVDELPIIWDRSDGRTFTNRPDHYFTRGYDVALHAFKGDPRLAITGRSNIIRVPPVGSSERELLVERPIELYEELIKRTTYPGEVVADFFVGSGSCLAAAAKLQRGFFGIEQDPGRHAAAMSKISIYLPEVVKE